MTATSMMRPLPEHGSQPIFATTNHQSGIIGRAMESRQSRIVAFGALTNTCEEESQVLEI
jgi:hypothetical protein